MLKRPVLDLQLSCLLVLVALTSKILIFLVLCILTTSDYKNLNVNLHTARPKNNGASARSATPHSLMPPHPHLQDPIIPPNPRSACRSSAMGAGRFFGRGVSTCVLLLCLFGCARALPIGYADYVGT